MAKNFIDELKDYLAKTPKEKIKKDWDKSKHLDSIGITCDEFLKSKI